MVMKLIKAASGKRQIKISKKEWEGIGKKAGWIKEAEDKITLENIDKWIKNLQAQLAPVVNINSVYGLNSYHDCQDESDVDNFIREQDLRKRIGVLQKQREELWHNQQRQQDK
jgi:hypothetical protein